MPIFDFLCQQCGHNFDVMISNADKDKVKCPECNSGDVKQLLSLFNTAGGGPKTLPASCQGCSAMNSECFKKF
ncbi:MAG TPA: zinc ribbon domain-containing protein [Gelria sp.]|jgi:putative FmdB family regulatory protein|nr:zinc ribbon domain-containing protein [Gelria sp.]